MKSHIGNFGTTTSAAIWIALSAIAAEPAHAQSSGSLPGGVDFHDEKCNAAFARYLSCFAGENLKRCYAKFGKKLCEDEASLVIGDLGVAWAQYSVLHDPGCAAWTYQMIEKNLKAYQELFGCKPR